MYLGVRSHEGRLAPHRYMQMASFTSAATMVTCMPVRTDGTEKELLWSFDTGGPIKSSVAVIDGVVVVTNVVGDIIVIGGEPNES